MRAGAEHTDAEQERLGLYLLGALDDEDRESFEDHLAGCWACLDEATGTGPAVAGLASLAWPAEFGGSSPPASHRDVVVPLRARRRVTTRAGAAVAAGVLVLAGTAAAVEWWPAPGNAALTASAQAPDSGVSLSVTITTTARGDSTIRLTVTGQRIGLVYRLYAVTRDGVTHAIRDWTATSPTQQVAGETSLPIRDLSFVTVALADGTAIVTAPISH